MQALLRSIVAAVLLFAAYGNASAQRAAEGTLGVEAGAGIFQAREPLKDFALGAAVAVYGRKGNYQRYGLEYGHREHRYRGKPLSQQTFMLDAGHVLRVLGTASRSLSFHAGLGAAVGYESFNRGKEVLADGAVILDRDGMVYGAQGLVSLEFYVSDQIVLVLRGKALLLWGTDHKQFRPSSGVAIRFNLN